MYHNSLNPSPIVGHLGCFQSFVIIFDILVVKVGQASVANRPKL